jgi:hypothetical protein
VPTSLPSCCIPLGATGPNSTDRLQLMSHSLVDLSHDRIKVTVIGGSLIGNF